MSHLYQTSWQILSWKILKNFSIGDSLKTIGWSAADIQAKIAIDPLASGNEVLKNTINNYNAAPVVKLVLPPGKTLAIMVPSLLRATLPRET